MKNYIKFFLKEIIPIVVGILIALYINNWNESRKDTIYINRISSAIDKELAETNQDIIDKLVIQKVLVDTLQHYLNDDEISLKSIVMKAQGVHIPTIKMHTWKAISNSKIELMDYEKVSTLANIEEQKEILKIKTEKLIDFAFSNFSETGQDKKEFVKMMMQEIIGTEISLQKDLENYLTE